MGLHTHGHLRKSRCVLTPAVPPVGGLVCTTPGPLLSQPPQWDPGPRNSNVFFGRATRFGTALPRPVGTPRKQSSGCAPVPAVPTREVRDQTLPSGRSRLAVAVPSFGLVADAGSVGFRPRGRPFHCFRSRSDLGGVCTGAWLPSPSAHTVVSRQPLHCCFPWRRMGASAHHSSGSACSRAAWPRRAPVIGTRGPGSGDRGSAVRWVWAPRWLAFSANFTSCCSDDAPYTFVLPHGARGIFEVSPWRWGAGSGPVR